MADGEKARAGERGEHGSFAFDAGRAFSRNIGWLTEREQQALKDKTVAIAGMGGVGGVHALTLARLGIGHYHLADMDTFELANFNRQVGATVSTIGRRKTDVIADMVHDINPDASVTCFSEGIDERNIDDFLDGADLFIDGFDFFVLDIRAKVFARCAELGIPALTAAPVGMGVAYMTFMPGGMTFEQYFRLDGQPTERRYVNFVTGLTPKRFHMRYLVDPTRVDFAHQRVPSTGMACQLAAGVIGIETLKALLRPEDVKAVPWVHHYDAYRGKFWRGRITGGNRHPLQALKRQIGYRMFARMSEEAYREPVVNYESDIERILDLARWAPSGDNNQSWRFDVIDDKTVRIRIHVEPGDVYNYNGGEPTLLAAGFLIESIAVAATQFGRSLSWRTDGRDGDDYLFEISLAADDTGADPLADFLRTRSVDRTPYRWTPLTVAQKRSLEEALGDDLTVDWRERLGERWRISRLNAAATDIRLRIPEAYVVHKRILDWKRRFSPDGVPVQAIGLDPLTIRIMRWAMTSWKRMHFLNRMPGGTGAAQLQMDILPGLGCAAHFLIYDNGPAEADRSLERIISIGRRLQRFWLTAESLGLAMQPGLAPLCFAYHAQAGDDFTTDTARQSAAHALLNDVQATAGQNGHLPVFSGRVGIPRSRVVKSRSIRQPLETLLAPRD